MIDRAKVEGFWSYSNEKSHQKGVTFVTPSPTL